MKLLKKRPVFPLNLRVYFTAIVLGEIVGMLILTSSIAKLLGSNFDLQLDFPVIIIMLFFSVIIGYTVNFFLSRAFFRPITRLGSAMQKVAKGDFTQRMDTTSHIGEVQDLYTDFNIMTQELRSTEIMKTDFVSNVSHEFKTPINAIQGYATLLQQEDLNPGDEAEYAEKILLNTRRLSDLVGNILLLSRLDNSSFEISTSDYRLDEQIRLTILLFENRWTAKNIDFDIELEEITYHGNEKLLAHVFSNLIDNAVKFSPDGGVIKMRLSTEVESIVFTIEDNGPGIPSGDAEHIFDRFYQADSSHKTEGNGLGLSLVKQILTVCGGTVVAENRDDAGGARFRVTLPVRNM